jgi:phosphate transport system permease protein
MTPWRSSSYTRVREAGIRIVLMSCAAVSVLTTVGIIVVLVSESLPFFREVWPWEFLLGRRWAPLLEPRSFGALPLLCGTFLVAGGAMVLAVPAGVGAALFLSEYAPNSVRAALKPALEVLAGIPSVVYGYFALHFITPKLLRPLFADVEVFNAASAAIVVAIMVLPTICSLCDDAFRAVPQGLRDAAYALAATRLEVSTRVVFPAALSGVIAAVLLALARAVGETMAVALAAGMMAKLTLNPFTSVQTMTAYIVQIALGDAPAGTVEYYSIFVVGLTLFAITLAINSAAHWALARFREVYE